MSDQVQVSSYSTCRRRLFQTIGADELSIDSHTQPVALIEDFTRPELRPQLGWNTWSTRVTVALVAGQRPWLQLLIPLVNPGNRFFVVEGIIISNPTLASAYDIGLVGPEAGGAFTGLASRYINVFGGPSVVNTGTVAAPVVVPAHAQVTVPAGGNLVLNSGPFPFMVSNELGVGVFKVLGVAAASAVTFTVFGYDRPQADGEL